MKKASISSIFHYVPLHHSQACKNLGRASGELGVTKLKAEQLIQLPIWSDLSTIQKRKLLKY
jgi:dTDP-4-amino-4,6-dideoxygalactose transaminase